MSDPVAIDGSYGEGGGQVLRTALALACITQTPVEIANLRAGRKTPGLAAQHLTCVRAAADICRAEVHGDKLGSQWVRFTPGGPVAPGDYTWDVSAVAGRGSAGATSLVIQTVLLPLALAAGRSTLTIKGGTHVPFSPPMHYLQTVFLPALGLPVEIEVLDWGWYPRGGGAVRVEIDGPAALSALDLEARGPLARIEGVAAVTNLPAHIPQRMVNRARGALRGLDAPQDITPLRARGPAPGAGIFLTARYANGCAGFSALGKKGKASEAVAEEACNALLAHHRSAAAVDKHLADQLVLPCALAAGRSVITTPEVTLHLTTNIHVVQQFVAAGVALSGKAGAPGRLEIAGVS
ncbi:MAG: RNA 3'-phosphate cyclase [Anaerolineae bacterium]|nr:RNA 3'-phosphate cyclase [Anaerolineae bacterium]